MPVPDGMRLGPYDVVAPLGAGGMGEVYRATDSRLKRQVAIKILPAALASDPDRLARFQREAEVLASLNHPQIAAVYGLEDAAGVKALVMELVEGPTLADRIARVQFHSMRRCRSHDKSLQASKHVVLYDLASGNQSVLIPGGADARYVNTGHLVYMKSGTLMAVPFDASLGQLTGAPVALIEGVMQSVKTPNTDDEAGSGQFAVSTSGTLVYAPGGASPTVENTLAWVERNGSTTPFTFAAQGPNGTPRISPDGQKIAVTTRGKAGENREIWVYDALRGAPTRLTFDGADSALWSADGKRLIYGHGSLQIVNADGSAKPETLAETGDASTPTSWASAANAVVFLKRTQGGANGIWVVPMESGGKPRLFLESHFDLWHPDLSSDGRLMAYVSFESGTPEVYVQSYPGPGEKVRISAKGGFDPLWTAGGRELLYRSADLEGQYFFSVAVRSTSPLQVDAPRLLFQAKAGFYDTTAPERSWHVSLDGKRFLLLQAAKSNDKPVTVMHVVLNWAQELSRLAPAK